MEGDGDRSVLDLSITTLPTTQKDVSVARWEAEVGMAEVLVKKGKLWGSMGVIRNRKLYCHVEEAAYMVEQGSLVLLLADTVVQRHQVWDLLLVPAHGCSWDAYQIYSHLKRLGYIVGRHDTLWTDSSKSVQRHPNEAVVLSDSEKVVEPENPSSENFNPALCDIYLNSPNKDLNRGVGEIGLDHSQESQTSIPLNPSQCDTHLDLSKETDLEGIRDRNPNSGRLNPDLEEIGLDDHVLNGCCGQEIFVSEADNEIMDFKTIETGRQRSICHHDLQGDGVSVGSHCKEVLGGVEGFENTDEDFSSPEKSMEIALCLEGVGDVEVCKDADEYSLTQEKTTGRDKLSGVERSLSGVERLCVEEVGKDHFLRLPLLFSNMKLSGGDPCSNSDPQNEFNLMFDVHLPNGRFRKTAPGFPAFSLCIAGDQPPEQHLLHALKLRIGDIPLKFGFVDCGHVSIFSFSSCILPTLI